MDDLKGTGRIEAFSDGVFAVAITLLVLGLQPPRDLLDEQALLFATIGIMCSNQGILKEALVEEIRTVASQEKGAGGKKEAEAPGRPQIP